MFGSAAVVIIAIRSVLGETASLKAAIGAPRQEQWLGSPEERRPWN